MNAVAAHDADVGDFAGFRVAESNELCFAHPGPRGKAIELVGKVVKALRHLAKRLVDPEGGGGEAT